VIVSVEAPSVQGPAASDEDEIIVSVEAPLSSPPKDEAPEARHEEAPWSSNGTSSLAALYAELTDRGDEEVPWWSEEPNDPPAP